MYTTITTVREFSGFDDSTKISATTIRGKIAMADAKIDGAIGYRYNLPLAYHRQNTITFSGTGTGSGALTATINGSTYAISISNTLTASAAADLMRVAMVNSTDFTTLGYISEETSGDAVLTIISRTDSSVLVTASAEVNITDAGGTVQGITATAGTVQDRYTPLISQISAEIASALLLMDNYGIEAQDTPKDGVAKMDRLDEILSQLQGTSDKITLKLYDEVDHTELTQSSSGLPSYKPTVATSDDDYTGDDPTQPNVTIKEKF